MLNLLQRQIIQAIALGLLVILGLTAVMSPTLAVDRSALILRMQELRSTSPESGAYAVEAASFNVAVTDAVIEDLQTMSEHVALGLQCDSPEVREISNTWNEEIEEFLVGAQEKRSRLVIERLNALRSTSPESGI